MAKIKHWLLLSRIPFLSVTVFPYILGTCLAYYLWGKFNPAVFFLGLSGAMLVQLATHYSGEIYDVREDRLSITLEKNFFTGGSQVVVESIIVPRKVQLAIYFLVIAALIIGAVLQFVFSTGKWTLLLGITGIISGIFYSKPPLRWVKRGWGEIVIAYAFGWLAVNSAYYIQVSRFDNLAFLVSLPVAFSVVNIILINEYPDYPADLQAGKPNLLVRAGKERGALLYALLVILSGAAFFFAIAKGLPVISIIFYLPVLITAMILAVYLLQGGYREKKTLERLCALTILVNLGTSLSCIAGLLLNKT